MTPKGLLKTSIRCDDPVMFLESELMLADKGEVPTEEYLIPIGKADIKRSGENVTIICWSKMVKLCLSAARELENEGISARSSICGHCGRWMRRAGRVDPQDASLRDRG